MSRSRYGGRRVASARSGHKGRRTGSPMLPLLFFPVFVLFHELMLRLFNGEEERFLNVSLVRVILFSIAAGLLMFVVLDLLPWKKVSRTAGAVIVFIGTTVTCVEHCVKGMFGVYYGISFAAGMVGQVTGEFTSTLFKVIFDNIPFILVSLIPFVFYLVCRKRILTDEGQEAGLRLVLAVFLVILQVAAWLMSILGPAKNFYTYDFNANTSIPKFGLVTTMRLEIEYMVFGTPEMPLEDILPPEEDWRDPTTQPTVTPTQQPSSDPSVSDDPAVEPTPIPTPKVYGYNVLDIDFEALAAETKNDTLQAMHKYFGGLTPSQQNDYTGLFEGKNLILITAEAFSPYAVDPELTPTLYRLTHEEGFIFSNFYQPNWTQSTSGGEFAVMTGLIPNWFGSKVAFNASKDKAMPTALGWQFAALGYSVPAWHNHTYTYYGRAETHPNLGYDYTGIGDRLVLEHNLWPNSDLEMMEATVDSYITDYAENGTPFHAYYMTVSGHGYYTWGGNAMSRKNKEAVLAKYPEASEQVQAYIACHIELDKALEHLIARLEAAGIADDTVIAMSSDHYPYLLVDSQNGIDYYNELRGFEDTEKDTSRYRNSFVLWCGSMDEPVVVDTPCSAIDIVPTLCNLFGLEYDSRLYSGRDIFATNYEVGEASSCMPLVVFANTGFGNSWITAAGTYEAATGTFTPNEGVTVADGYVKAVNRLVQAKYSYAKQIIQQDYYSIVIGDPNP